MSVVVNGRPYEIPGLVTRSWLDGPGGTPRWRLDANEDRRPRSSRVVNLVVLHTTDGSSKIPQPVLPGAGPYVDPSTKTFKYWSENDKHSGAHIWVGQDGTVFCAADLASEQTPHAGNSSVNARSIGIEMYTAGKNTLYSTQIDATVKLVDWLTEMFGIQRQIHWPYGKNPDRLGPGGANDKRDFVGVIGHREADSRSRGVGDPGNNIFLALIKAGYEPFDTNKNEDRTTWAARQAKLGVAADGIPGMATVNALKAAGFPGGIWVRRDAGMWDILTLGVMGLFAWLFFRPKRTNA